MYMYILSQEDQKLKVMALQRLKIIKSLISFKIAIFMMNLNIL